MTTAPTRGFTLIEIMVALLVLGIGLLGVAGLQSTAASMNQQSAMRTQATLMARDIADRMRANPVGVSNGQYDMGAAANPSQVANCTSTSGCTEQQMAQNDLWQWHQAVADNLPQPNGANTTADRAVVCRDGGSPNDGAVGAPACDGGGNYVVKLWWFDKSGDGGGGSNERFIMEIQAP